MNSEIKPVIHPHRKIPLTLLPKLKEELEIVEQLGAIKKIDQPTRMGELCCNSGERGWQSVGLS